MHLFRIWFQRLPDIWNFTIYFLALWPIFQVIPTLQEKSCLKTVLRVNLWVKFQYSGLGFLGFGAFSWHKEMKSRGLHQNEHFHTTILQLHVINIKLTKYWLNIIYLLIVSPTTVQPFIKKCKKYHHGIIHHGSTAQPNKIFF